MHGYHVPAKSLVAIEIVAFRQRIFNLKTSPSLPVSILMLAILAPKMVP
jgi:hypothetical protein